MWCWSRMEKIKWSEKVTSGDVKGIYSTHRDPSVLYVFKYVNQVLCLDHCTAWLRDLDTNKIEAEVFGEL